MKFWKKPDYENIRRLEDELGLSLKPSSRQPTFRPRYLWNEEGGALVVNKKSRWLEETTTSVYAASASSDFRPVIRRSDGS